MLLVAAATGCRLNNEMSVRRLARIAQLGQGDTVQVKQVKQPRQIGTMGRAFSRPPEPGERTSQVLRRYNLLDRYAGEPDVVIRWMKDICAGSPELEEVNALAELSLAQADWSMQTGDQNRATQLYATAVVHAYQFLFDSKHDLKRNAYDPQFREICDVYNRALEAVIREICVADGLDAGATYTIGNGELAIELSTRIEGRWGSYQFKRFELTSDYRMEGIQNLYHTYGLGVPLIAIYESDPTARAVDNFYPPELTLPMTAFFEVVDAPVIAGGAGDARDESTTPVRAVLKLYDPLEKTTVYTDGRTVPLESDITTPLAYQVNDALLNTGIAATVLMLNPAALEKDVYGLYMLEPFDPDKIPVVMVHGLWSSPVTWLEMFNDLRANPDLRGNYQFWFYGYPTGQPFWISARQMRDDLRQLKNLLDPEHDSKPLDQTVLVGHSMGGLVSRLQTIDSGDQFWRIISDESFDKLDGDAESLAALKETFFFDANPGVQRVITIATPENGSSLASTTAQWVSDKLFTSPDIVTDFSRIASRNRDTLRDPELLNVRTSVDSLSPDSPFFAVMQSATEKSDIPVHKIIGVVPTKGLFQSDSRSDGVVSVDSARAFPAVSEIEVEAEHSKVHQHPRSVLEVRRILLEHLVEHGRIKDPRLPVIPTSANTGDDSGSVSHAFRKE